MSDESDFREFRKMLASRFSDEKIIQLKGYVSGAQDWNAPSTNDLVALAELQNMLMMRGFADEKPARFELMDVADIIGLSYHQMAQYADIGNWIAMDRRFNDMDTDEIDEFYATMEEVVESLSEDEDIAEILTLSLESVANRTEEIYELNKLFNES